jgi:DNA-binding transcriptional ArsR family regulator
MNKKNDLPEEVIKIAQIAKALSHPVRVYILSKLAGMDTCCYSGNLVEEIPVGRSTLSQHLKELKYAGLIQGEINPPYIKYCINRENWEEVKELFNSFLNQSKAPEFRLETFNSVTH